MAIIIPIKKNQKLVFKDGRLYENGKVLRYKDYIYHADCHDGDHIITRFGKYRIARDVLFV